MSKLFGLVLLFALIDTGYAYADVTSSFLLKEDGGKILKEDTGGILLNSMYIPPAAARSGVGSVPEVQCRIQAIERSLGQSGRLLIRYSGTEPLLRIMVQGENEATLHLMGQELVALVKKHLGAG